MYLSCSWIVGPATGVWLIACHNIPLSLVVPGVKELPAKAVDHSPDSSGNGHSDSVFH